MFKALETSPNGTQIALDHVLDNLKLNADALIPAIAQQFDTGEVLMLAYMSRESIIETLKTGQVCYWSRSRQCYWRKGESSGHVQQLKAMRIDCDGDTLLLQVNQQGPACHTHRSNCFYNKLSESHLEVDCKV